MERVGLQLQQAILSMCAPVGTCTVPAEVQLCLESPLPSDTELTAAHKHTVLRKDNGVMCERYVTGREEGLITYLSSLNS